MDALTDSDTLHSSQIRYCTHVVLRLGLFHLCEKRSVGIHNDGLHSKTSHHTLMMANHNKHPEHNRTLNMPSAELCGWGVQTRKKLVSVKEMRMTYTMTYLKPRLIISCMPLPLEARGV